MEHGHLGGRAAVRLARPRATGIVLGVREKIALVIALQSLGVLEGTPLALDVERVIRKLTSAVPGSAPNTGIDELRRRFVYVPDGGTKSLEGREEIVDAVFTATIHQHPVRVSYRSRRRASTVTIHPYAIALYRNGLYVVGATARNAAPRTFALDRISRATRLRSSRFDIPPDFSIEDWFEDAFGIFTGAERTRVVARFAPEVADLVRARVWHRSQLLRPHGAGVELTLESSATPELRSWLVGWGPWVDVVSPVDLRDHVRGEHLAAARSNRR